MKRILPLILLLWSTVSQLSAIPADPRPRTYTQPDGTTVTLVLRGDESFHYFTTTDGVPVVRTEDGAFHFARMSDGQLKASGRLARNVEMRTTADQAFIAAHSQLTLGSIGSVWTQRTQSRNERIASVSPRRAPGMKRASYTGKKRGLCILVQFKDVKFTAGGTQAEFNRMFNEKGYKNNGHIGSVHDYFYDQSYGQFDMEFDVLGPVQLKYNMSYYGGNNSYGNDSNVGAMVVEALQGVQGEVDFSEYDWDGNGEVDQLYVLYAGYGENASYDENTIWPHEYYLQYSDYGHRFYMDGIYFNQYSCGCELGGYTGSQLGGIGVICHEYSHCLGLPDFYDTSSTGTNFGMNCWSVMDYGSYNNDGRVPAPYTAYERWVSGWLEPVELTKPTFVDGMNAIIEAPEAYVIYNEANRNEYYLLENHQQRSWDKWAPGHGMLILHVDYSATAWMQNVVNNTASRQRMTIFPADNSFGNTNADLAADPFPGTKRKTSFTDDTQPSAKLYNRNSDGSYLMGKPITEIAETGGLISFSFMGGLRAEVPVATEATGVTADGFTATWNATSNAQTYTLQMRAIPANDPSYALLMLEDFSKMDDVVGDGTFDITPQLDSYTQLPGWGGVKLYDSTGKIKLGTASKVGTLITPSIDAPAGGEVTVAFDQQQYGSVTSAPLHITLKDAAGTTLGTQNLTVTGGFYVVNFSGISSAFQVEITADKRVYLDNIAIYGGKFETGDFGGSDDVWASATEITGLTSTSYTFSNLTAGSCEYRVCAVCDSETSNWSNVIRVSLSDNNNTGIHGIMTDGICADRPVEVYSIDGRRLGLYQDTGHLPAGTYLLRQGRIVRKVIIR